MGRVCRIKHILPVRRRAVPHPDQRLTQPRLVAVVLDDLAGGGVLGALAADRASADVVGQVGTSADRVDVFAGNVDLNQIDGNNVVSSGESTDYEIQKDGTDGSGVINLKTQ